MTQKKQQIFGTHPVPGQCRKFVIMFMCFFFPRVNMGGMVESTTGRSNLLSHGVFSTAGSFGHPDFS